MKENIDDIKRQLRKYGYPRGKRIMGRKGTFFVVKLYSTGSWSWKWYGNTWWEAWKGLRDHVKGVLCDVVSDVEEEREQSRENR